MPTYQFQDGLYRSPRDMLAAIVETWITAGGLNTDAFVREALDESTDAEIAVEIIESWGLDQAGRDNPSHMTAADYTVSDLADAVTRYRAARQSSHADLTQAQLDVIAAHMDDDIREAVHADLAPCSPGAYLTEYLRRDPDFPINQFLRA